MAQFDPTPEQRAILEHDPARNARILAGPGTGKSATSVALVERLLADNPGLRIKLITFTRAATGELAQKVADHPAAAAERPSTIHSFALALLLRNPGAGNFPRPLRIADRWEEDNIVHPALARRVGVRKDFVRWQLIPEMASGWECLNPVLSPRIDEATRARFIDAWREQREVFGYTMLAEIPYALREAMVDNPAFEGFDYNMLIVDEYQDLNACDLEVLRLAAERGCTIIGAGDDDQSIYRFRWADPLGIRRFLDDYPGASNYPLSVTLRCGTDIVDWANYVIRAAPDRMSGKPELKAIEGSPKGEVALLRFPSEGAEARGVAELVQGLVEKRGITPTGILVLSRTDHHGHFSRPIRERLAAMGIPSFDPEIVEDMLERNRPMLAVLRLAANREDSLAWASLFKVSRGIGNSLVEYAYERARAGGVQLGRALLEARDQGFPGLHAAVRRSVEEFMGVVLDWIDDHTVPEVPENGWGDWIINATGDGVVPAPSDDFRDLLSDLDEVAEEGQDLARYIGLIGPLGKDLMQTECEGVRFMSMNASKGLTVDAAIIIGVEDQLVPRPDGDLAEERRLLYVAMTRAKRALFCTWARYRRGPQARAGAARVGGMRQVSRYLEGGR